MSTHAIEVLVDLLENQTVQADESRGIATLLQAEVEDLEHDLAEVKRERDEQSDDLIALDNEVMDLRDRLKTAESIANKRLQLIDDLESEIEGLNEFISSVDTLVKDQDWYELRVRFGYTDAIVAVHRPEYLETLEDYESAPAGTVVLFIEDEELDEDCAFTKGASGEWVNAGIGTHPADMAGDRRKVYQWGASSVKGLGNGL